MKKLLLVSAVVVFLAAGCTSQVKNDDSSKVIPTPSSQQLNAASSVVYEGVEGRNALDLLKEKYSGVETKHYSFGDMVVAINGKRSEDGKNFWAFYVNGQQSSVGASQYVTKQGDKIEWKLEEIKN